jgi:hypothetical protein
MNRVSLLDHGPTSWGILTIKTPTFGIAPMLCRIVDMQAGNFQDVLLAVALPVVLACPTPVAMAKCILSFLMDIQEVLEWVDLPSTTTPFLAFSNAPELRTSSLEM